MKREWLGALCVLHLLAQSSFARSLAPIDLLAFELKQTLEAQGLTVKSVDVVERDAIEPGLKRSSLKVEATGLSAKAMMAFEAVRTRSKSCAMQSLKMRRPAASIPNFDVSATWVCFEQVKP